MRTGDEASFDDEGYCSITGRIKDIIIRGKRSLTDECNQLLRNLGGQSIFPLEIEEILGRHAAISQCGVVGLPDEKYGEVVAAFLQQRVSGRRPTAVEVREFVRQTLGWHKAPAHIFWLEEKEDFPKTGSRKIQKHILREQGQQRLRRKSRNGRQAKL